MAKKSKNEADKKTDVPGADRANDNAKAPKGPTKKRRATAAKQTARKPAAREKTPTPAATAAENPAPSPAATEPSDDAIRMRAYFLAERRARLSLPGDSAHDWIEARRQLLEEAGQ